MTDDREYYVGCGGETVGPLPLAEIAARLARAEFAPDDFIWHDEAWVPLRAFPPLADRMPVSPAVPATCCPQHPDREALMLCAGCRGDFCPDCLTKHRDRYYCAACFAALPAPLAVTCIPAVWAVAGAVLAPLVGYWVKLYLVLTVGCGCALGLCVLLTLKWRLQYRIGVALLTVAVGIFAWYHYLPGA